MNTITNPTDNPAPGPGPEKYTLRIAAPEEIAAITDYVATGGAPSRTGAAHSLLALGAKTWLASRASPLPAPCQQIAGIAAQEVTTATDELPADCQQNTGRVPARASELPAPCQPTAVTTNEPPSTRQPLWRRTWAAVRPYWPFGCGFDREIYVVLSSTGALWMLIGMGAWSAWSAPIVAGSAVLALVAVATLGRLLLRPSRRHKHQRCHHELSPATAPGRKPQE